MKIWIWLTAVSFIGFITLLIKGMIGNSKKQRDKKKIKYLYP
jgi:hypothetical protein